MTIDELKDEHARLESSVIATSFILAQDRYLLGLVESCLRSPSRENLDVVARERARQVDFILALAKQPLAPPSAGAYTTMEDTNR